MATDIMTTLPYSINKTTCIKKTTCVSSLLSTPLSVLPLSIIVLFILSLTLTACQPSTDNTQQNQENTAKTANKTNDKILTVTLTNMPNKRLFSAMVTAKDSVEVHSQLEGMVDKVMFKQGDWLKKGEPLYQLNQQPYRLAIKQSKSAVRQAKASLRSARNAYKQAKAMLATDRHVLKQAKADLERYQLLISDNAVSEQAYQQAVSNVRIAKSSVRRSKALVAQSLADINTAKASIQHNNNILYKDKQALKQTLITAPISGKVIDSTIKQGTKITAESNPQVTIAQLNPIFVDIPLTATEWQMLQPYLQQSASKQLQQAPEKTAEIQQTEIQQTKNTQQVNVELLLAEGERYPQLGDFILQETKVKTSNNSSISPVSSTSPISPINNRIIVRALFNNDKELLLPNMPVTALVELPAINSQSINSESTKTESTKTESTKTESSKPQQVALLPIETIHYLPIHPANITTNTKDHNKPKDSTDKDNAPIPSLSMDSHSNYFVYLLNDNNQPIRKFIKINGLTQNNQVIVTQGLKQDDKVMLQPPIQSF